MVGLLIGQADGRWLMLQDSQFDHASVESGSLFEVVFGVQQGIQNSQGVVIKVIGGHHGGRSFWVGGDTAFAPLPWRGGALGLFAGAIQITSPDVGWTPMVSPASC